MTNQEAAVSTQKRWTLADAIHLWKKIHVQLDAAGFLCGIYGSVLEGEGRDLDLLIIPKRINTSAQRAAEQLAETTGGTLGDAYDGIMGTQAYILMLANGQLVDLQFYKPRAPKDAEELFLSTPPA